MRLRACLKILRCAAARDFGCGQGGEVRASPQRAVRTEPTKATGKRPAARRVFAQKAVWLRCSSVEDPPGIFSFVPPRHSAFCAKTAPLIIFRQALSFILFAGLLIHGGNAFAQGTAFTYQGRLNVGGSAANGSYDLRFAVYDGDADGNQLGVALTNSAVAVSNGLFTTTLDFGSGTFNASSRWLEIAARTNSGASFTTLSPRQFLAPAPTAIFAATAGSASIFTGTLPPGGLSGAYGSPVLFTNSANTFNGNFVGNGAGLVNVAGTIPAQTITGTNVQALPNRSYVVTNSQLVTLTLPSSPNIGDIVRVAGAGYGGWNLAQNAGQSIPGHNLGPATPWTRLESVGVNYFALASSADGVHLIGAGASILVTSSDSGASWSYRSGANQPNALPGGIAMSADGKRVAVADGAAAGHISLSTDYGTNFTVSPNAPTTSYAAIASSADGDRLVAAAKSGGIYSSSDFGINWATTSAPSNQWCALASSADGSRLVAASTNAGIYISTDFGVSWNLTAAPTNVAWRSVCSSFDGFRLGAVGLSTNIYTSADGGQSWVPSEFSGTQALLSIACSADGLRLATCGAQVVFTSTDGGVNWTNAAGLPPAGWRAAASSATGNLVVADILFGIFGSKICTTTGVAGYLNGGPYSAVELQYLGNGLFLPISHEGTLYIH